ncbi:amidohydrolase family protein [Microbacterium sp. NPDC090007]|uniref:amidohydrolase family protein n=1 Tax=Microbacterium sp. NPDC090007 TaxID=3364204 RepID=UPI0038164CE0
MIIDAHVHVWDLVAADYAWPNETVPRLYRTFTVEDLAPALDAHGIDGVVLVQADDTAADTENMFAEAARSPRVRGVVAWADLSADAEHFAAEMGSLRRRPRFVGLRNLSHVKADPHWIRGRAQQENIGHLASIAVPLDMVTSVHAELGEVTYTLERHPTVRVVLDHLGKPPVGGTDRDRAEWAARLRDIASAPQTTAKVSGLSSSVGPLDAWTVDQVVPFVEDAMQIFGPERLMFGGDWPLAILAGGYDRVWDAVGTALGSLTQTERAAVLGGTATRVYDLR